MQRRLVYFIALMLMVCWFFQGCAPWRTRRDLQACRFEVRDAVFEGMDFKNVTLNLKIRAFNPHDHEVKLYRLEGVLLELTDTLAQLSHPAEVRLKSADTTLLNLKAIIPFGSLLPWLKAGLNGDTLQTIVRADAFLRGPFGEMRIRNALNRKVPLAFPADMRNRFEKMMNPLKFLFGE